MIPIEPAMSALGLSAGQFLAQAVVEFTTTYIIGTWIAALLTICIFSFLYDDNPLYKFAEHLFVGVSAGYVIATTYQNTMVPNLYGNVKRGWDLLMQQNYGEGFKYFSYILAGLMGVLLLMKLIPSVNWIARWPLSFMVGTTSGLGVVLTMEALVLKQLDATIVPLIVRNAAGTLSWGHTIQNWVIVLGVCSGLIYFYFSQEHKGVLFGTVSKIGIYVLMMAFGAAFGYTVMARVSLLIGQMLFFRDQWWPVFQRTFGITG